MGAGADEGQGRDPARHRPVAAEPDARGHHVAADAPTTKKIQYYEMLGTRALWQDGWKVVAEHGPMPSDVGHFDEDKWQLFHTAVDRAEAHDLAAEHPEKVQKLVELWFAEAGKYDVLPLCDLGVLKYIEYEFSPPMPPDGIYAYFPGTTSVPERSAASVRSRSYRVLGEVEVGDGAEGVIFAHGSRFGGHALFVKDGHLHYVYNFIGIPPEQHLVSSKPVPSGRHVLGVSFDKEEAGDRGESLGTARLWFDEEQVGEAAIRTQSGHFSLCGEGLCVGRDGGDAVSEQYRGTPFAFTGGRIVKVVVDLADDAYVDRERELAAAMARD